MSDDYAFPDPDDDFEDLDPDLDSVVIGIDPGATGGVAVVEVWSNRKLTLKSVDELPSFSGGAVDWLGHVTPFRPIVGPKLHELIPWSARPYAAIEQQSIHDNHGVDRRARSAGVSLCYQAGDIYGHLFPELGSRVGFLAPNDWKRVVILPLRGKSKMGPTAWNQLLADRCWKYLGEPTDRFRGPRGGFRDGLATAALIAAAAAIKIRCGGRPRHYPKRPITAGRD